MDMVVKKCFNKMLGHREMPDQIRVTESSSQIFDLSSV